jgi:hypothetical protein
MNSRRRRHQLLWLATRPCAAFAAACGTARYAFFSPQMSCSGKCTRSCAGDPAGECESLRQARQVTAHNEPERSFFITSALPPLSLARPPADLRSSGVEEDAARPSGVRPRRDSPHVRVRRRSGQHRPPGTCPPAGSRAPAWRPSRRGEAVAPVHDTSSHGHARGIAATPHRRHSPCTRGTDRFSASSKQ